MGGEMAAGCECGADMGSDIALAVCVAGVAGVSGALDETWPDGRSGVPSEAAREY